MNPYSQRWLRLALGALAMIGVGFIYGWSIFSAPFAAEFGWDAQTLSLTFSILMVCFCVGNLAGSQIAERFSVRISFLLAAIAACVGFIGALAVRQDAPWVLYCTYGVFAGLASGIAYVSVMAALIPWFPERTGLASGLLLMCYGCATMLLGTTAAYLFSKIGWRMTFVALACGITAVLAAAMLLVRKPRLEESQAILTRAMQLDQGSEGLVSQKSHQSSLPHAQQRRIESVHDYDTWQMLKSPAFYVYGIWMLLLCSCGLGFTGHCANLALAIGLGTAASVLFVSLYSVTNTCGRFGTGMLFDILPLTTMMAIIASLHGLGAILIITALTLNNTLLLVVGFIAYSCGMAGVPVVGSGFAAKYFGPSHYANNLAVLNLIIIPAAFIGPSLMSFTIMLADTYTIAMVVFVIFSLIALACSQILRRMS